MCKHTSCVEVCPVDCFYEGKNTLAINPDECIDCGVCEPECPEEAIIPDHLDEDNKWLDFNTKWSNKWPQITEAKDPMTEYAKHSGEEGNMLVFLILTILLIGKLPSGLSILTLIIFTDFIFYNMVISGGNKWK